ncbi:HNH endonuclease [Pandoraea commovens]|uniref:HNH endonuclease n=1 Tax=Pandoraea commovens TaxID=2508289 RepID=A0ABY5Q8Q3_9BURK|nr:HNH endonuclease [Pandoraea commovens]UVA77141.1 HNH endonuclease [Pandoraea commovens]
MAATCIVCGEPAGSKEHLWPAVLGGRVTARRIYCQTHNRRYGALVAQLGERLLPFNGMLGVVPDNDKHKRRTPMKVPVPGSDATVDMSDHGTHKRDRQGIDFSDPVALLAHRRAAQGEADGPWPPAYILPATGKGYFSLGDRWTLAGATYIAQTLFASAFPNLVRTDPMQPCIAYTAAVAELLFAMQEARKDFGLDPTVISVEALGEVMHDASVTGAIAGVHQAMDALDGRAFQGWVWSPMTPHPEDEFGLWHRVVVGIDGTDGLMFGRVRFFGEFELAMVFGWAPAHASGQVTYHINPLTTTAKGSMAIERSATPSDRPPMTGRKLLDMPREANQQHFNAALDSLSRKREAYLVAYVASQWAERFALAQHEREVSALAWAMLNQQIQFANIHLCNVVQTRLASMAPTESPEMARRLSQLIERDDTRAAGVSEVCETALWHIADALRTSTVQTWRLGHLDRRGVSYLLNGELGRITVDTMVEFLVGLRS